MIRSDLDNDDIEILGCVRDDREEHIIYPENKYFLIRDHILWVDGYAELCWSLSEVDENCQLFCIVYQIHFSNFFKEWSEIYFDKIEMVETF